MIHDLIESAAYMAHGYCLLWKPWLVSLHAGSDLIIAASYFAIPFAIWLFLRQRPDLELKPLAMLFAAFILLCGLTHIIQLVTLWWPVYETQGVVKLATAAVSMATALFIFPLIPKALAIPSPRLLQTANTELKREVGSHKRTLAELTKMQEELEHRVAERTAELERARARYEALVKASAQIVWTTDPDGMVVEDSPTWRSFTGQTYEEWKGRGWLNAVHPDDRERTIQIWRTAVSSVSPYDIDYRLRHVSGEYRWTTARAVPLSDEKGAVAEWVGMNTDITDRVQRENHIKNVMRELSHRTKNLLAVIQSIARRTFADDQDAPVNVEAFNNRLRALAISHDLLVQGDWNGTSLEDLVLAHLEPFGATDAKKISIKGPAVWLKSEAAQNLGMALHELATNAAKHGALRDNNDELSVSWQIENGEIGQVVKFNWKESLSSGNTPPTRTGFGTLLLQKVVAAGLGGTSQYELETSGAAWSLTAPLSRLLRAPAQAAELS